MIDVVQEAIGNQTTAFSDQLSSRWNVEKTVDFNCTWTTFTNNAYTLPTQGYKLHVSSSVADVQNLIAAVLPVLFEHEVSFKIASSTNDLRNLLNGKCGLSQVGKFITIYPTGNDILVRLGNLIESKTSHLSAPRIPFERALNPTSCVFYRYGGIHPKLLQLDNGEIVPAIENQNGVLIQDSRNEHLDLKLGIEDPFKDLRKEEKLDPVIKDRYLRSKKLSSSPKGICWHCVDLHSNDMAEVVVKIAQKAVMIDKDGIDAYQRLEAEALVIKKLDQLPSFPIYVDFWQDNESEQAYLVYKYKDGITVNQLLINLSGEGVILDHSTIINWATTICGLVQKLHEHGVVHGDLKPANILIDSSGAFHLIDFELSHAIIDESKTGFGTIGYASSSRLAGESSSSIKEDIYSLGAILYSISTSIDLAFHAATPDVEDVLNQHFQHVSPDIARIITKCMGLQVNESYQSVAEVIKDLSACNASQAPKKQPIGEMPHFLSNAQYIGDSVLQDSLETKEGLCWRIKHSTSYGHIGRDLYIGISGIGIYLIDLYRESQEQKFIESAEKAAKWLMKTPDRVGRETPLPGLFFGESGVGLFFLRLYSETQNDKYLEYAINRSEVVCSIPCSSSDIMVGAAGIGLFHIELFKVTGDRKYLDIAVSYSQQLTREVQDSEQNYVWDNTTEDGSIIEAKYIGFAHGSAGIGYFFAELHKNTSAQEHLEFSISIACWLESVAKTFPISNEEGQNVSGINWPSEVDSTRYSLHWCHGATGIGKFFLNLFTVTKNEHHLKIAKSAANAIYHSGKGLGTTRCHGLAGSIDYLLDIYQITQEMQWYNYASNLGKMLSEYCTSHQGRVRWYAERPDLIANDFMVGECGIGHSFLRINNPHLQSIY